jgi:hypothetical protein
MSDGTSDRPGIPVVVTPAQQLRQDLAALQSRCELAPLLQGDVLPPDIRSQLAAAVDAGSPVGPEIAAQLHRLRDMQLGLEEVITVIQAAANRVVADYISARERGGKLSAEQLANIDVAEVPAKTFAREFAVALGNQVRWRAEEARHRQAK